VFFIRQNATHKVVLGPAVAVGDGFTPITTLDISTSDEAEAILHDNGTVVDISAYTWAAITTADGYYHLTLQSGISGTVGHLTIVVNDDSLCLPLRADFTVLEEAVYDAMYAASAAGPLQATTAGRTLDIQATGEVDANLTMMGGVTQSATDLKDFADEGYDPATNKVQGVVLVDTLTTYTGNTVQTADVAARVPNVLNTTALGNIGIDWANVENPTSIVDLSATDIQLCDTVTTLTGHTPQTGDTYAALPTNFSDLAITVTTGRVDVGSWLGTAVTTSATTAKPEVDAYSISNDATAANNAELAFDGTGYGFTNCTMPTVTTLTGHTAQTGDTFGALPTNFSDLSITVTTGRVDVASVGGTSQTANDNGADLNTLITQIGTAGDGLTALPWNSAWDAEVESEVNDALDTAISELGVAAPTATPTLRTGLMLLYMALRNKLVVQTSGTDAIEIYNDAGTLIAQKLITDDSSDYTEAEMTSG
jgi:hypothetical protein